jgi:hypothetical protein
MRSLSRSLPKVGLVGLLAWSAGLPAQAQLTGSCGPTSTSISGSLADFTNLINGNGNACQITDKLFSDFNTAGWGVFPGDTTIAISESGSAGITHSIVLSSSSGFNGSIPYNFNYKITRTGVETLDWWRPSSSSSLGSPDFNITWTTTNPAASASRNAGSGLSPQQFFTPGTDSTVVTTTLSSFADGPQSFQLTLFQTPGPLPVLGAGVAFGFSRKLRKRIKHSA